MREAEPPVQNVHLDISNKTIGCDTMRSLRPDAHPLRGRSLDAGLQMNLFDEIARTLGMGKADQKSEIAEFRASFTETKSQLGDFEARLIRVEKIVEQFVSAFETKLDDLAALNQRAHHVDHVVP
jgi:hypothetical protein